MARYLVERTFAEGLHIPLGAQVVERNAEAGVTWLHSYVAADKHKSYCVCDAPTPEAIRTTAAHNHLPVERITEIRVLDPYFYS